MLLEVVHYLVLAQLAILGPIWAALVVSLMSCLPQGGSAAYLSAVEALERVHPTGVTAGRLVGPIRVQQDVRNMSEACRHLWNILLAAAAHQQQYEMLPASMDDLVPEFLPNVPIDPYDGKPMRLAPLADGLVAYGGWDEVHFWSHHGLRVPAPKDLRFIVRSAFIGPAFEDVHAQPAAESEGEAN